MNTFFIIKQLFIHSQIDEKALSGDSLFFYVIITVLEENICLMRMITSHSYVG